MESSRSSFSLKLIIGFPIVGIVWASIIYFLSDSETLNFNIAYWIAGVGIFLGLLCLLSKSIFLLVWWMWCKIIFIIDTAITWFTLPIFYYLIFSPFATLLRFFGKANMRNSNMNQESYWKDIDQPSSSSQYLRQF